MSPLAFLLGLISLWVVISPPHHKWDAFVAWEGILIAEAIQFLYVNSKRS